MCEAITASAYFLPALTGLTLFGGYQQNEVAKDQARAMQQVGANNAKIMDYRIKDAVYRGELRTQRHRQAVQDTISNQKVAFASKGFQVDTGSPLETLLDTAEQGEIDAMIIRGDVNREIYSGQVQQQSTLTQAEMDAAFTRQNGFNSLLSSGIQAASYHIPRKP